MNHDEPEYEPVVRSTPGMGVEAHLSIGGRRVLCGDATDAEEGWRRWGLRYRLDDIPFTAHGRVCADCAALASDANAADRSLSGRV